MGIIKTYEPPIHLRTFKIAQSWGKHNIFVMNSADGGGGMQCPEHENWRPKVTAEDFECSILSPSSYEKNIEYQINCMQS
jgi:hypothetical protein